MGKYILLASLIGSCASAPKYPEETFWHEPCLSNGLKACGEHVIKNLPEFLTEKDKETMICRIVVLAECRNQVGL